MYIISEKPILFIGVYIYTLLKGLQHPLFNVCDDYNKAQPKVQHVFYIYIYKWKLYLLSPSIQRQ